MMKVSPPLGDVVKPELEQRARAFAAELLLPREQAAEILRRGASLTEAMRTLQVDWGASLQLATLQIMNGSGWRRLGIAEQGRGRRYP